MRKERRGGGGEGGLFCSYSRDRDELLGLRVFMLVPVVKEGRKEWRGGRRRRKREWPGEMKEVCW